MSHLIKPLVSGAGCDGAGGGPSLMSREEVSAEARLIPDGKDTLNWWTNRERETGVGEGHLG